MVSLPVARARRWDARNHSEAPNIRVANVRAGNVGTTAYTPARRSQIGLVVLSIHDMILLEARSSLQPYHPRIPHMPEARIDAGQDDDLAPPRG